MLSKSNILGSARFFSSPEKGRPRGVLGLAQSAARLEVENKTPSNSPLSGGERYSDSAFDFSASLD
jgi:hypothetical protein